MRDLEIRGAGEILGGEQSGHMKTVGMSHFLRLLKQTVDEMQSGAAADAAVEETVEINLPIEAFIPGYYIPDEQEKINVYQKLAGSEDEAILAEFEQDLTEEYGEMPIQVLNLFKVLRLKMSCRRAGITRVKAEVSGKRLDIVLSLAKRVTAEHLLPMLAKNPKWKVSGETLRTDQSNLGEDWFGNLKDNIEVIGVKKVK
jgi:transcription-repair coupling factor (superfamily II helicase)